MIELAFPPAHHTYIDVDASAEAEDKETDHRLQEQSAGSITALLYAMDEEDLSEFDKRARGKIPFARVEDSVPPTSQAQLDLLAAEPDTFQTLYPEHPWEKYGRPILRRPEMPDGDVLRLRGGGEGPELGGDANEDDGALPAGGAGPSECLCTKGNIQGSD